MLKEALQYIVGLRAPEIQQIDGQIYSDKELSRISYNPKAEPLHMSTLTSLVDYLHSGTDVLAERMIVQIVNPTKVVLTSMLDQERQREKTAVVEADVPDFRYGYFIGHEEFLIALQSKFIPGYDRNLLLKFAGTVENGTIAQYGDDGVTQKATVKTGIASKGEAVVPNPVKLSPYRTFTEVGQPESSFIFRMKEGSQGDIQCAIFEADGGTWRNAAMKEIKEYLASELEDIPGLTIIS